MKKYNSLKEVQALIEQKMLSLPELLDYYFKQIEKNEHLNAFNEVFFYSAAQQAKLVQEKITAGTAGRLAGMVIGIKDNICYKDHQVTASSKMLEGFVSPYSATVVERLISEDAVIIGRLNCDEFAMGGSNETSYYGAVKNAADHTKVAGGSSGGSAVAVQADLCLSALGTDTGGSVRQPAAFCGCIGLKPTYGRISRYGVIAYASSFDQVGTITSSVSDAAILLEVLAGADDHDSTVSKHVVPAYLDGLKNTAPKRIAVLKETLESDALDTDIKETILKAIEALKSQGHTVEYVSFDLLDYLVPAYYVLTTAEASSNLSRYDGVHYGHRNLEAVSLNELYKQSRAEGFGEEVKRRILLGTFVLSAGYYDAYYQKAQQVRRLIREKMEEMLSSFDLVISPVTPTPAFNIGENIDDPLVMYMADIFTVLASLTGIPAIAIPLGNNNNGLPLSMQLMARHFGEQDLLSLSHAFLSSKNIEQLTNQAN
ncbi:Asp-tRNA(Asn)/Glu-tRNA(Gln) amidotransferase subunit GatA [Pedobacter hiemivivus]|uniref:Glutamyl-tRNA(Gln) amidotransferase subunit A n=1 Tax=Pedobacter hiemivivus TaxID=2530454 RepID=A0A4U1GAP3_9SPHI|nr:Asp-tRNA(Asn)/Glu-tRNA(Gln) amidotransferase subunit GatA [Pedobacter hiemivivus]TKC60991.1 Asp-tRNA(Asn)/Glu-tRNA(Gln) amidotransferase subunit GatA [Pedobacter hiemivivus]